MEVNRRKWWIISLAGTVGFFFAIAPVLDPYIVIEIGSGFTLKINDIIMLFLTMLCFSKSYRFERKTGFLCTMYIELGRKLYMSKGSEKNLKLTTTEDIEIFKALLQAKKDEWMH